jgi:3-oxoacyl-[acyl-carrier-protein] synthase III
MDSCVGIVDVALYLPPLVRHNDWWPREVVAGWTSGHPAAAAVAPPAPAAPVAPASPGAARVAAALVEQARDPFQGAAMRHVMPDGMTVLDMAEQAARQAIERAGVAPGEIDLLLTHTVMPDVLLGNAACQLHHRLGLPRRCFAMETDAAAYSFVMQLGLAEAMITAGRARVALLVQSCGASRHIDMADPISPLFGDGATAVLVRRVSSGRGIQAAVHHVDGRFPRTLVAGVRGGAWGDPGPGVIHVADAGQMREVFLQTADVCKESIAAVLAAAGRSASEVGFFAMYQGTPWLRGVVQDHAGLSAARSIDSFARTGYLFAAVLPAGLALAVEAGALVDDDLVLITGGGTGMTFGSLLMKWGS